MTGPIEIAPCILSADHARLGVQVAAAIQAGARRIHVDIMGGHFVPNLSFGPGTVAALAPTAHAARGMVECHLMAEDPDRYTAGFAGAGADVITVHAEACRQLHRTIETIRAAGRGAGVALNPATPPEAVEEILTDVDLVLVMTVDPGFGGQELIPSTLDKVYRITDLLASRDASSVDVEVDGGDPRADHRHGGQRRGGCRGGRPGDLRRHEAGSGLRGRAARCGPRGRPSPRPAHVVQAARNQLARWR